MALKDEIYELLARQPGAACSGQELAGALGVSRAAVWKGIQALRADGLAIEAATNRGYTLAAGDLLLAQGIADALHGPAAALRVECTATTPGTNAALRERAALGEPEGLVLAADEQTAGRGRSGRSFCSPKGSGLYLSILLRPTLAAPQATLLTAAAAAAAARAVAEVCGRELQIKWVNDLLLEGRKVCGILTEAALNLESGGLDYVVLGLGLNVCPPAGGWPEELSDIAGSLLPGSAPPGSRNALAAAFLNHFMPLYHALPQRDFLPEYRARQCLLGQPVNVLRTGQPPRPATALAIDEDCRLLVRWPDGTTEALHSGEVRVRAT